MQGARVREEEALVLNQDGKGEQSLTYSLHDTSNIKNG